MGCPFSVGDHILRHTWAAMIRLSGSIVILLSNVEAEREMCLAFKGKLERKKGVKTRHIIYIQKIFKQEIKYY